MNEVIEWADGSKNDGMTRIHKIEQLVLMNYECYHRRCSGKGKHKQRMENIDVDPIRDKNFEKE